MFLYLFKANVLWSAPERFFAFTTAAAALSKLDTRCMAGGGSRCTQGADQAEGRGDGVNEQASALRKACQLYRDNL